MFANHGLVKCLHGRYKAKQSCFKTESMLHCTVAADVTQLLSTAAKKLPGTAGNSLAVADGPNPNKLPVR